MKAYALVKKHILALKYLNTGNNQNINSYEGKNDIGPTVYTKKNVLTPPLNIFSLTYLSTATSQQQKRN